MPLCHYLFKKSFEGAVVTLLTLPSGSGLIHSVKYRKKKLSRNQVILSKYITAMYLCNIFTNEIIPVNIFPQVLKEIRLPQLS